MLDAQFELRQQKDRAVVLIVSGIPAAGRSEVVNEVLGWLDPKLVTVHGFKACSDAERERPPLWRFWHILPPKGRIAILHGGWYQDLLQQALEHDGSSKQLEPRLQRVRRADRATGTDAGARRHHGRESPPARLARDATEAAREASGRQDDPLARHARRIAGCAGTIAKSSARWSTASMQPITRRRRGHLVDGTDAQHRALEVGRRLLEALQAQTPVAAVARNAGVRASRRSVARESTRASAAPTTTAGDQQYDRELERLQGRLALLSRRKRFAEHAVVAVFEGMDAAGKGGAIRRITAALDARQFHVVPISAPSPEELARPYLWRFWSQLPPRGNYTIFDRSWYGRVLVERVRTLTPTRDWRRGYDEIVEFERQLDEHGIVVVKFWLAVSREEQLERFKERDRNPLKRFKVDPEDWANRKHWDAYQTRGAGDDCAHRHTARAVDGRAGRRQAPGSVAGPAHARRPDRSRARLIDTTDGDPGLAAHRPRERARRAAARRRHAAARRCVAAAGGAGLDARVGRGGRRLVLLRPRAVALDLGLRRAHRRISRMGPGLRPSDATVQRRRSRGLEHRQALPRRVARGGRCRRPDAVRRAR